MNLVILERPSSRKTHVWCRCSCGVEKEFWRKNVLRGLSKSCGHGRGDALRLKNRWKGRPRGEASARHVERTYRVNAKKRGLGWHLTIDDVRRLMRSNCHYCAAPPQRHTFHRTRSFRANGIDRKNNARGYVASNCVPACTLCNRAKGVKSYASFRRWLRRLIERNAT